MTENFVVVYYGDNEEVANSISGNLSVHFNTATEVRPVSDKFVVEINLITKSGESLTFNRAYDYVAGYNTGRSSRDYF